MSAYLTELRAYLTRAAEKLRHARDFSAVAHVEVAADIAADAQRVARELAAAGHRSECYDREAEQLLTSLLATDRHLNAEERRCLRIAARLVHRSAEADHAITELAACPATAAA